MSDTLGKMLGEPVAPAVAHRPDRITLTGRFVTLQPLQPHHADDLYAAAGGSENAALWTYLPDGPYTDPDAFRVMVAAKAVSADPLFYAIGDNASGRIVGHAGLMRIDTANRVIEVGNILFGTPLQRSPGATEAMALLAALVFDALGYRRYEWKCNSLNIPSRRAAERLGFRFEGVFRQHMIVKGANRNTAWFSMLDREWPVCRDAFARWLAPENFDDAAQQRQRLAALRA